MDDPRFPPNPEESMSGYYGESVRAARRLVRLVPRGWPPPLRITAQIVLGLVGVAFVTAAWIFTTVVLLISNVGGAMGGGSGSNPRL
jgi:hypothetical protein